MSNKVLNLGAKLVIDSEEYESLDEIIARFVNPISDLCQELMRHAKFFTPSGADADMEIVPVVKRHLLELKKAEPKSRPYVLFYKYRPLPLHSCMPTLTSNVCSLALHCRCLRAPQRPHTRLLLPRLHSTRGGGDGASEGHLRRLPLAWRGV